MFRDPGVPQAATLSRTLKSSVAHELRVTGRRPKSQLAAVSRPAAPSPTVGRASRRRRTRCSSRRSSGSVRTIARTELRRVAHGSILETANRAAKIRREQQRAIGQPGRPGGAGPAPRSSDRVSLSVYLPQPSAREERDDVCRSASRPAIGRQGCPTMRRSSASLRLEATSVACQWGSRRMRSSARPGKWPRRGSSPLPARAPGGAVK